MSHHAGRIRPFAFAVVLSAAAFPAAAAPGDHAPAGVMADHMHERGEVMAGYRLMIGRSGDTILNGTGQASDAALAAAGFSSVPTRMAMRMHMLDLMYAPSDWLTLMAMPQYVEMHMDMRAIAGAVAHGGHGGHGGAHAHGTSGWGDTSFTALVRLFDNGGHRLHMGLGVSAPTGSVSEHGDDGRFTHYMMQLGSGTWDALPSMTYAAGSGAWGWGAQASAVLRLEDTNPSGFRFGDRYQATLWGSRRLTDWLSASLRVLYTGEGDLSGHYNGAHNHSSPPDLQANYGGDVVEAGLGLNAESGAAFGGLRLGAELLLPVHETTNGYQQKRDWTLILAVSRAF